VQNAISGAVLAMARDLGAAVVDVLGQQVLRVKQL
jgi:hypothetical protein